MHRLLAACLFLPAIAACSWVSVEPGAKDVLVLPAERLTADCESLGIVKVSVLDKVGVLERHDEEVVQDLNVLARNHAAKIGGDTAVPLGPAENGERRYEIHRCTPGDAVDRAGDAATEATRNNVEVLPYDGG